MFAGEVGMDFLLAVGFVPLNATRSITERIGSEESLR